jgi:hypothetical protein
MVLKNNPAHIDNHQLLVYNIGMQLTYQLLQACEVVLFPFSCLLRWYSVAQQSSQLACILLCMRVSWMIVADLFRFNLLRPLLLLVAAVASWRGRHRWGSASHCVPSSWATAGRRGLQPLRAFSPSRGPFCPCPISHETIESRSVCLLWHRGRWGLERPEPCTGRKSRSSLLRYYIQGYERSAPVG